MHITSPIRTKDTVDTLARLWEASVRRSHHFLTEADIRRLTPFVKSGLGHIERLFVTYVQNVPAGFIGLEKNKLCAGRRSSRKQADQGEHTGSAGD